MSIIIKFSFPSSACTGIMSSRRLVALLRFSSYSCSYIVCNSTEDMHPVCMVGIQLDVTGSKLFRQFCIHTQLLQSQRSSVAVGLFVHTQAIVLDFICCNCSCMIGI